MPKSYVFVGPTISVNEAKQYLPDAEYLPPVKMGDIIPLVIHEKPFAIGIIDGLFGSCPSVFHKEILYAITQGIHVFGAASMGALRAAELMRFGMHSIGEIAYMYRSGELTGDDEVAIAHADAEFGYKPLSEAMVNIRATLHKAWEEAVITTRTEDELLELAKSWHYTERNYPQLIGACPISERDELEAFIVSSKVDLKKRDAIELLKAIKTQYQMGPPRPHTFSLELTYMLEDLILKARCGTKDRLAAQQK